VTVDRLRAALAGRDVHRIVPTAFVFLDALPLSPDLKVDRRRLPPPGRERPPLPGAFVPPGTALERRLARIWSEVLEIDPVGATDSFLDLGGDSLRAGQVVTRVRDELGHALPIATLFDHATIRALAAALAAPASA
jgi:acyl carrier protein